MDYKSVSIVIATYNGKSLLEKYLPSVAEAAEFYPGKTEIILVDDGGTDESEAFVKSRFPKVNFIKLTKNIGPLLAVNIGFKASQNQIVISLDNDVLVDKDFIAPLVAHFDKGDIFGVGPSLALLRDELSQAQMKLFTICLRLGHGFIEAPIVKLVEEPKEKFIFLLGGGGSAFDREKLLALGGFDELLSPFYWEDADLSYRAWKRGWKILLEPQSRAHHQTHSTISKQFSRRYVDKISERNRYIIVWKNILDKRILLRHILWIPLRLVSFILTGKWWRVESFFLALRRLKKIRVKRKVELAESKITDKELFDFFSGIMEKGSRF